jgi:hypothetical protein
MRDMFNCLQNSLLRVFLCAVNLEQHAIINYILITLDMLAYRKAFCQEVYSIVDFCIIFPLSRSLFPPPRLLDMDGSRFDRRDSELENE